MYKLSESSIQTLKSVVAITQHLGIPNSALAEQAGLEYGTYRAKLASFLRLQAGEPAPNRNQFTEADIAKLAAWKQQLITYFTTLT